MGGINDIQQDEQQNMRIVTSINQIDAEISDLYGNLEVSSVNTSPDISNQQNTIKKIDTLQKLKTSLYTNLNDSYKATQLNLLEARDNLVNKVAMSNIAEHELSNTNTNLSVMKNIRNDKLRMAEINNYYSSKYDTQTTVMKTIIYFCIPILILGILVKKELLPQYIGISIIGVLCGLAIVVIYFQTVDIMRRDNMVFDEYDWGFNPKNVNLNDNSNDDDQPKMRNDLNNVCIGQACCPPGNTFGISWDASKKVCTTGETSSSLGKSTDKDNVPLDTTEPFVGSKLIKHVFDKSNFNVNIFKNTNKVLGFNGNDMNYAKF
jgi:2-oxo-4-hydroxy-4-carboxy--5-ureidoimidazoline (OHCU) decarboxylase